MRKKLYLWAAVAFTVAAVVFLLLFFLLKNHQTYADEVITKASGVFQSNLEDFLDNSEKSRHQFEEFVKDKEILTMSDGSLNTLAAQLIDSDQDLKGVVLFSDDLNYVFFRDNTTWVTTFSKDKSDSLVDWQRLNAALEVVSGWTDTYNFFMDEKNFTDLQQALKNDGEIIWTAAQSEIPDKRELLFSVFRVRSNDRKPVAVAFMYKTGELGKRFSRVLRFAHPLITILTTGGQTVTPISSSDTAQIALYKTLSKQVEKLIETRRKKGDTASRVYSFENRSQVYWSRIENIRPLGGVEGFVITVSENDILATAKQVDNLFLYVAAALLLLAGIWFLLYRTAGRRRLPDKVLEPMDEEKMKSLIAGGESEFVEFKSSLRWDYREEKVNKALEDVILKSIAAFANAKGGTLFIGVSDDKTVLGLEPDFNSLKKKDVDYFELHLRKLINNQYGIRFANTYLLVQFAVLSGKTVCVIQIAPSHHPLYLKTKNKQGQQVEKFYVRSGNASQEIDSLNEMNEYIRQRFNE